MTQVETKKCSTCQRVFQAEEDFLTGTSRWRVCNKGNLWFNCSCNSTLLIKKGKFSWYQPENQVSQKAQSLFVKILELDSLPHFPATVLELQQIIMDENSTATDLAQGVKNAPFIATDLLKIANNLKASDDKEMESIEHAIVYVGRQQVADLAVAAALRRFVFESKSFKADKFWEESISTAMIAEKIAKKFCPHIKSDEAYLAGCLSNVGKVVAAITMPELVDEIHCHINDLKILTDWKSAEDQLGILDHTVLGEIAGAFWGFPPYVCESSIKHHNLPAPGLTLKDAQVYHVAAFANQLTHWIMLEPTRINQKTLDEYTRFFELDMKNLEQFADELMLLKDDIRKLLEMNE